MRATERGIVSIDIARLDRLLNLVGELVMTRTRLVEQARQARTRHGFSDQVLNLFQHTERLGRLTDELQSRVLRARMVPVESSFRRFERLASGLPEEFRKEVRLIVRGGKTEVDKRTIDDLAEPLLHLVRNALDHGIESTHERERLGKPRQGTIALEACYEADMLVVTVTDDGAGISLEAVKRRAVERGLIDEEQSTALDEEATLALLFRPGFSTASKVTDLSGRGVGLDAARIRVESLGGRLRVLSTKGKGTRMRVELPLTAAILDALIVRFGEEEYAIPLHLVCQLLQAREQDVQHVQGREAVTVRGRPVHVLRLAELLDTPTAAPSGPFSVVVVKWQQHEVGLVVERIMRRQEVVLKGLGSHLGGTPGIAGACCCSGGKVVLVLDVAALCDAGAQADPRATE